MNLKNVLRTYSLLRQLSDDESALLDTLRSLSDSEREQMVETLSPARAVKKAATKPRVYEHCAQCDKTKGHSFHKDSSSDGYHEFQSSKPKSARATALAEKIKGTGKVRLDDNSDDPSTHCQKEFSGGFVCNEPADANVHHLSTATGFHEFVAGKSHAASAGERSSANPASSVTDNGMANPVQRSKLENGAAESSSASSNIVSSVEAKGNAGSVPSGVSGG